MLEKQFVKKKPEVQANDSDGKKLLLKQRLKALKSKQSKVSSGGDKTSAKGGKSKDKEATGKSGKQAQQGGKKGGGAASGAGGKQQKKGGKGK